MKNKRASAFIFTSLLVFFLGISLMMVAHYLLAVLMGLILSLLSYPLYRYLSKKTGYPKISAGIITLALLFLVIGPMTEFLSIAIKEAIHFAKNMSQGGASEINNLLESMSHWRIVEALIGDPDTFKDQLRTSFQDLAKTVTLSTFSIARQIPDKFLELGLALLTCFFLLFDGKRFLQWMDDKIPVNHDTRAHLFHSFKNTAFSVIWSTFASAMTQVTFVLSSFFIFRIPGAFLAGAAAFILAWIPLVGSTPIWLISFIYLYGHDMPGKAVAIALIGVVNSLVEHYIRAWVLKGRSNMHPLVTLLSIFGGLKMFGIFGVFFGPILAAMLTALLQTWPSVGRDLGLIP